MQLNDHLLYIDITNQCGLDCEFCMYEEERSQNPKNMKLDQKSSDNLSGLINNAETDHIIISGEGEPINNLNTIYDILSLSTGNKKFQIITNGTWLKHKGKKILSNLDNLAEKNNDVYSIRLSFDSYHHKKVKKENYKSFFEYFLNENHNHIEFAIRSVKEDQEFVRSELTNLIKSLKIPYTITEEHLTDDVIILDNKRLSINYKNLIYPNDNENMFSIWDYMNAIESKYEKRFTLGNLKTKFEGVGLDITIKPDGDVYFYGIELETQGNIHQDNISIQNLKDKVHKSKLITNLYSKSFLDILHKVCDDREIKRKVELVNNPYWIIKELYLSNKERFDEAMK